MSDLISAARRGDVSGVLSNIRQARQTDSQRKTALMHAAMGGHLQCVELLAPHEAGMQDNQEWPAILFAARDGYPDIIRYLLPLEGGLKGEYGQTALMTAALNSHLDCAELLLQEAGQVTTGRILSYPSGTTALMIAASKKNSRLVELLLPFEQGLMDSNGHNATWYMNRDSGRPFNSSSSSSDINTSSSNSLTTSGSNFHEGSTRIPPPAGELQSLIVAVIRRNEEGILACISEAGQRRLDGNTALMHAARSGYVRGVELLLDLEGGLQDDTGKLALDYAIINGNFDCAKLLLPVETDVRDSQGHTPFDRNITKHNDIIIRLLTILNAELSPLETAIMKNYDVCAAGIILQMEGIDVSPGCTSLMAGVIIGREDLVTKNLEKIGCQDDLGRTALMYAAIYDKPNLVHFFLEKEARKVDSLGWTALMHAVKKGSTECVRLLLCETGIRALSDDGTTALILAAEKGDVDMVTLLAPYEIGIYTTKGTSALSIVQKKHFRSHALLDILSEEASGCKIPRLQPLPISLSPLAEAVLSNDLKKVRNAMKKSQPLLDGEKTALMLAAERGFEAIVHTLRVRELGRQDSNGWTALMYAIHHGKVGCVKLLLEEANLENAQGSAAIDFAELSLTLESSRAEHHSCRRLLQEYIDSHQSSLVQGLDGTTRSLTKIRDTILSTVASDETDTLNSDLSIALDAIKRLHPLAQKYDQAMEKTELQALQKSLDEARMSIKELKDKEVELTNLQSEYKKCTEREEKLKSDLKEALQKEENIKTDYDALKVKVDSLSDNIKLSEQLENAQKKNDELEKELAELKEKVREVTRIPSVITSAEEYSIVELDALEESLSSSLRVVSGARAAYRARVCVICMEKTKSMVLKPCCHLCVCETCSSGLKGKVCPICRKSVEGTIRVYD